MARRRNRSWSDQRASHRTARVGELIRRIVAEEMERLDDDRLAMVSITGVGVDRDLHRAVVWFTTLDSDDDEDVAAAFEEHRGHLRWTVGNEARLRKIPKLVFRPDEVLRTAERIEALLARIKSDEG